MEKILVNVGYEEKNFTAGTDAVNGVVIATAKTLDKVIEEFKKTFKFHIETCIADGEHLPEWVVNEDYEFYYQLSISALLQKYDGFVTRSALSRVTGINERQLGHYATGYRKPRKENENLIIEGFHKIGKEFLSVV